MILHMLGAGPAQVGIIERMKERGFQVAVSDMNPRAAGLALADYPSRASTFDPDAVIDDARRIGSDRFLTAGTDQPVLTCALASERLGKPYFLTSEQALMVTNKRVMKSAMARRGIPTSPFVFLSRDFREGDLAGLSFPLVVKPLDSQGQRGVVRVESIQEIRGIMDHVLSFSRCDEILAEEYYPSREVTVSGWVGKGRARILSLTDRATVDNGPHLGVCVSHRYPSLVHRCWEELAEITQELTNMVGLKEGPVYFQILHGEKGFLVNEIACRLGGAYEEEYIPPLCGVSLREMMIDLASGQRNPSILPADLSSRREGKFMTVQMFFARPGRLARLSGMDMIRRRKGVLAGQFLLSPGTLIERRENSSQRAGYFIALSNSRNRINSLIKQCYQDLSLTDDEGQEMLEFHHEMLFP